ncbi:MAG: ABC transporter ATP-binding protein [bacterium]
MIEINNLTVHYGSFVAVDQASFKVEKGEILGLLGPNGAGKSTIMKVITTYLVSTMGKVTVGGYDAASDPLPVREMIGYLPETVPLYKDMLVCDYLKFAGRARGLTGQPLAGRIQWVVEACGIKSVYTRAIYELSRGFKQRVGLAQALIHDPQILILDEPTSGLDPLQIIDIRELIKNLAREKTIIFSTHILQEVTAVSDRVVIINQGRIIADGTISELEKEADLHNTHHLTVKASRQEVLNELNKIAAIAETKPLGESDEGLCKVEITGCLDDDESIWKDIDRLVKEKNWMLKSFGKKNVPFEDTFILLTQKARHGRDK